MKAAKTRTGAANDAGRIQEGLKMGQTSTKSPTSNDAFLSYSFVHRRSRSYPQNTDIGISGLALEVEYCRVKVYALVRSLQAKLRPQNLDEEACLACIDKKLNLQPGTARKYVNAYLPFYDPTDESKFEFRWNALATLGVRRLQTLAPIVAQLFANPSADFCMNFHITMWSIEILTGKDPGVASSWCDARLIDANQIPSYYYLANLDQNGKPLPLPEDDIEVTSYDDIDFSDMFR